MVSEPLGYLLRKDNLFTWFSFVVSLIIFRQAIVFSNLLLLIDSSTEKLSLFRSSISDGFRLAIHWTELNQAPWSYSGGRIGTSVVYNTVNQSFSVVESFCWEIQTSLLRGILSDHLFWKLRQVQAVSIWPVTTAVLERRSAPYARRTSPEERSLLVWLQKLFFVRFIFRARVFRSSEFLKISFLRISEFLIDLLLSGVLSSGVFLSSENCRRQTNFCLF